MKTMEQRENFYKRIYKISTILTIIAVVILIYSFAVFLIVNREHCEHKAYTDEQRIELLDRMQHEINIRNDVTIQREEIKPLVQSIIKPVVYIEIERDIDRCGLTIAQLRLIIIDTGLSDEDYAYTLTHEYVHLVCMIHDEALTDFITIKTMWESGNEFLQRTASRLVRSKLTVYLGNEYDCTGELIEYFSNN